jgi:hypothetical protein
MYLGTFLMNTPRFRRVIPMIQAFFHQKYRMLEPRRLIKIVEVNREPPRTSTMAEIADTLRDCSAMLSTLEGRVQTLSKENKTVRMTLTAVSCPGSIAKV